MFSIGNEQHLDEKEAARYLRVSVAWLRKQRRLANGPPVRRFSNRLVRYEIGDLMEWSKSRKQGCANG